MPGKLCVAALLVFILAAERGTTQEFFSADFGKRVAQKVLPGSAAPSPASAPGSTSGSSVSGNSAPSLIQPAVCNTPDGYPCSVEQAGYTEPALETPSGQDHALGSGNSGAPGESLAAKKSEAGSSRDLGFPMLAPPGELRPHNAGSTSPTEGLGAVLTVISSLALVLGLFFITAWFLRRTGSGSPAILPNDVFELLGRAQLNNRQQVHLLRCGTKLLLVSVTADGAETLTEIDDPDEVTRLAALCKANQAGSATAAFRHVLHQFARQPADAGFVGPPDLATRHAELRSELENLHG